MGDFYVYWIVSGNRAYIGATVNPTRRLRLDTRFHMAVAPRHPDYLCRQYMITNDDISEIKRVVRYLCYEQHVHPRWGGGPKKAYRWVSVSGGGRRWEVVRVRG